MFRTQIRAKGDRGFRLARAAALAALIVGLLAVGSGLKGAAVIPRGLAGRPGGEETRAVAQRLAVLERGWVPNAGQWDERAAFAAPGFFGITWVTKDGELRHVLRQQDQCRLDLQGITEPDKLSRKSCPARTWVLSERWVGGEVTEIRGVEGLPTQVSYFIGNDSHKHQNGLLSFRELSLGTVWEGVEVRLRASQATVEKRFFVAPRADLRQVQVEVVGAEGLALTPSGALRVRTGLGEVEFSKPAAWQEKDGEEFPVEAGYVLLGDNRYGFEVKNYDPSLPLVIDPILQATYLGGLQDEWVLAMAVHPTTGEIYVAGSTTSTDLPQTTGGAQQYSGGNLDAFVARLNPNLTSILQVTYLGGSNNDRIWGIALSPAGEVYVVGWTASTNFPNTTGRAYGGGDTDAFVTRLNSSLTGILSSTYLGGTNSDVGFSLAIYPATGQIYVAGWTTSADLPSTTGGAQPRPPGNVDGFVARLSADLSQVVRATYLGGSGDDFAYALAVSSGGDVYVAGETSSQNLPGVTGGAQPNSGGNGDAFVARLRADLSQVVRATYLGGSADDGVWPGALAIHPATGEVYAAGGTASRDFPGTAGGAQARSGGGQDAFVARLNADLTALLRATYLGGSGDEGARGLALSAGGDVYLAGETFSDDLPGTAGGAQTSHAGGASDAFVARLKADLTQLLQATYLGGTYRREGGVYYPDAYDWANALLLHPGSGEVYVAGGTRSTDFPSTAGGAQPSRRGGSDAFVARLTADLAGSTITVNGGGDAVAGNGRCDLAEAIRAAVTNTAVDACPAGSAATADTVVVPAGTYTLTRPLPTDTGGGDLLLQGAGAGATVIQWTGSGRLWTLGWDNLAVAQRFEINGITFDGMGTGAGLAVSPPWPISSHLIIRNSEFRNFRASAGAVFYATHELGSIGLVIRNSVFRGNESTGNGGVIASGECGVSIEGSLFENNTSVGGNGGVLEGLGPYTILRSIFRNNRAGSSGGAIYVRTYAFSVSVHDTTFESNQANVAGGAIAGERVRLTRSTLSGNAAPDGGAVFVRGDSPSVTALNTTFSGNRGTSATGGAAISLGSGATAELVFVTFADNSGPAVVGVSGSGSRTVKLKNVVLADPGVNECGSSLTVQATGVVVADDSSCGSGSGFLVDSNLRSTLGSLADNGGPTRTHALLSGSAAIDAVTDCKDLYNNPVDTDQRGVARPQGPKCDAGAFEREVFRLYLPLVLRMR
jgi:predicted outer membrane repeat protein